MAQPSVVYRFQIELSDSDRGVYRSLEFRAARHPSETEILFAARVVAYCLNAQEGLEIMPGISSPDEPALRVLAPTGSMALWVDVGMPDARRLHKASKLGAEVRVYLHKEPYHYLKDLEGERIHRKNQIRCFSFRAGFLEAIGRKFERDQSASCVVTGGTLFWDQNGVTYDSEINEHRLSSDE
jgi:uncharacterized protein YaeQ